MYLRLLFNVLFETISMISKFPRCWWRFALLEKEEWLFTFIIMVCLMLKLLKILFYFMDFYMLLNINPLYTDKKKCLLKKIFDLKTLFKDTYSCADPEFLPMGGGSTDNFLCRRVGGGGVRGPLLVIILCVNLIRVKFPTGGYDWLSKYSLVYVISEIIFKEKEVMMIKYRNHFIFFFVHWLNANSCIIIYKVDCP